MIARGVIRFGRFWWEFVVGDEWRIAAGVVAVVSLAALLTRSGDVPQAAIATGVAAAVILLAGSATLLPVWGQRGAAGANSQESHARLIRRGFALGYATLAWNLVGVVVLVAAAAWARSVALIGFGLDSLIEIGASTVVIWELSAVDGARRQRALRLIGWSFAALAVYLAIQSALVLALGHHAGSSPAGIAWTTATAGVMFALATGKSHTGAAFGNEVLLTEGRVTCIDGLLAVAVLAALVLNSAWGWWWADPAAGLVLVFYAMREAWLILASRAQ
jgi:hypothetical protein